IATTSRRNAESDDIKATDVSKMSKQKGGYYSFENGHMLVWSRWADPTTRPVYAHLNELTATHGPAKAQWMVENLRNLCLYPNLYRMDRIRTQLRVIRRLPGDQPQVTIYGIAPKTDPPHPTRRPLPLDHRIFTSLP